MRISIVGNSFIRAALTLVVAAGTGLFATMALAANGTINLTLYKAGFIVGGSGGSGTLTFEGKKYPVNIGGVSAHIGAHNRAHVITAKAALVGLTKAIAVEFADRGITANCVVPGKIGGRRSGTSGESPPMAGGAAPLAGREGTPEEVAAMVRQLCLPQSRYITGQTLHVSGGMVLP